MNDDSIALSPKRIAKWLDINLSTYYRRIHPYIATGEIKSVLIGRSRRILTTSFRQWLEQQAELSDEPRRS